MEGYHNRFGHASATVSRFEQEALCRFLTSGAYGRHLRRTGNLYRKKCALFTEALEEIPGVTISGADAGLHFLVPLPRFSETELVDRAAAKSVGIHPLSRYCHSVEPRPSTVVLGFAGLTEDELSQAAVLLKEAWA